MKFKIVMERISVDTKPKWWSQELETALLGTEGTVNTLKLTIPKEDYGSMVGKVRTYMYDHHAKPIRAKWCKDGLKLWVPTEDEIKMMRKKVRSEKGKVFGFKETLLGGG